MDSRVLRVLPLILLLLVPAYYLGSSFICGSGEYVLKTIDISDEPHDPRSDWLLELHNYLEENRIPYERRRPFEANIFILKRLRRNLANMRFVQKDFGAMERLILSDLELLDDEEELEYGSRQIADVGNLVQRRLNYLQNQENCSDARTLECEVHTGCGLGCMLHHVSYCLIVAYGSERILVFSKSDFNDNRWDWTNVFQPLSDTCTKVKGKSRSEWPGSNDTQVLTLPFKTGIFKYTRYSPLPVPQDLLESLDSFHNFPVAWWVGQILRYILRPQNSIKNLYQESIKKLNFRRPIVGVQIRRTDKLKSEAKFHRLTEYMLQIQHYYDMIALNHIVDKRRIFVATNDSSIFTELRKMYPEYEVIGDENIAKMANGNRNTAKSFDGILRDIVLLALTDHIVCTFTSNVCRMSYELMQTLHPDASGKAFSLDSSYFYSSEKPRKLSEAVLPHKAENDGEIDLELGDLIIVNKEQGYNSLGKNIRTNKTGQYPTFKTVYHQEAEVFPTYSNVL